MKPCRQSPSACPPVWLLLTVMWWCGWNVVPAATTTPTNAPVVELPGTVPDLTASNQLSSATAPVEPTPRERPPDLDPAFDFSPDLGGIREFLLGSRETAGPPETEWKQRIEMARKQRESGEFNFAFANLQAVLDGNAREELKKTALLEFATTQYSAGQYHEALKTCGMFRRRYPQDAGLPQVLLFQGLLLRELGASQAALGKFHSVLSATLNLNFDDYQYYRKIVVLAQSQIAETLFLQGKLSEAAEKYTVLLRSDSDELARVRGRVRYQLILCLEGAGRHADLVAQARTFLDHDARDDIEGRLNEVAPHVRYLLATSLKQLGRNNEALAEVKALLQESVKHEGVAWTAWKQRTGNEIANQLYREGDYFNALSLYLNLAELDTSLAWQLPVWYQIGLIHERLEAPPEAVNAYQKILDRETELSPAQGPALATLVSMARWRRDFIQWKLEADKARVQLQRLPDDPTASITNQ